MPRITLATQSLRIILERIKGGAIKSKQDGIDYFMPCNGMVTLIIENEETEFFFPSWMGETPRQNAPWTEEEERVLYNGFVVNKLLVESLAYKHGRTIGGILSKLEKWFPNIREKQCILMDLKHQLNKIEEKKLTLERKIQEEEDKIFNKRN